MIIILCTRGVSLKNLKFKKIAVFPQKRILLAHLKFIGKLC